MKTLRHEASQRVGRLLIGIACVSAIGCVASTTKSHISKAVGPPRQIPIRSHQVWSGRFDPDGPGAGGGISLLVSRIDNSGNLSGYMESGLLFGGNGRISGAVNGSEINFTLQHETNPSKYEYFSGTMSDGIRGRYRINYGKSKGGAFALHQSNLSEKDFMASYNDLLKRERLARMSNQQSQQYIFTNSPNVASPSSPSGNDWYSEMRQESLMERQTEALEQMQRDASWDGFQRQYQHRSSAY